MWSKATLYEPQKKYFHFYADSYKIQEVTRLTENEEERAGEKFRIKIKFKEILKDNHVRVMEEEQKLFPARNTGTKYTFNKNRDFNIISQSNIFRLFKLRTIAIHITRP